MQEHGEKEKLNHPGGDSVMEKVGGKGAGLPFIAFLDAKGGLIVNAIPPGQRNIGHPFAPEEVGWFMQMLAKAAPRMTAAEKKTIDGGLRSQKK